MKRADLKVGEEYAVLAPSQNTDNPAWWPSADRVMVVDTDPKWTDRYYSWRHNIEETAHELSPTGTVKDRTYETDRKYGARSVKCMVREVREYGFGEKPTTYGYDLVTKPLSQLRMTWAEYETKKRAYERARAKRYKAQEDARKDRAAKQVVLASLRDDLQKLLPEGFTASYNSETGMLSVSGYPGPMRALFEEGLR